MEKLQVFKDFLENLIQLDETKWNEVKSIITIKKYKKNDILLYSGDICSQIVQIVNGVTRMYYIDDNANEYTCHISYNPNNSNLLNQFAVDFNSYASQEPSRYFIEALSDLEVLEINQSDFINLITKNSHFSQLGIKLGQLINNKLRDELIDVNTLSNTERYEMFLENYKNLPIKIPQYIIASYLGITPVALSRLKNR